MQTAAYRECTRCEETKDAEYFQPDRHYKGGLSSWCRGCQSETSTVRQRGQRRAAQTTRRKEGEDFATRVLAGLPEGFGDWFAGFTDGEGHFGMRRAQPPHAKEPNYYAVFQIVLSAADAAILCEIRDRLGGIGRLNHSPAKRAEKQYPAIHWTVSKKSHLIVLVRLFDIYPLRAKKAREYAVWRKAVLHWWLDFDERPIDWSRMATLFDELLRARHGDHVATLV